MAKLIVNNHIVEHFFDANTPFAVAAQLVFEQYGENARFDIQLSEAEQKVAYRQDIRNQVATQVADSDSLLGTTSDTVHLLLNELSGFINKLANAQSLAEMRASATSLQAAIGHIETQVLAGDLQFPYQVKGLESVNAEIVRRANGVNLVLKSTS
ncbi:hypothetical protein NI389_13765 [Pseudoalteromonas xiamenensis]|uniref:hypothetical protein n=1 Tax=Pseudoalteromonas xiamenensis TaxID=882626 RepID=UPI0027E54884|nr:hypothetical protein [Pseudoalteromonas xiamenensis]WMN59267.1 hypothetical protein NI389_13765 [Pseudoalteromonas xiamenensis]